MTLAKSIPASLLHIGSIRACTGGRFAWCGKCLSPTNLQDFVSHIGSDGDDIELHPPHRKGQSWGKFSRETGQPVDNLCQVGVLSSPGQD